MKINKKINRIIVIILLSFIAVLPNQLALKAYQENRISEIFNDYDIQDTYNLCDKLAFSNKVLFEDNEYFAEYFLLKPSKETLYGNEFVLDEVGKYYLTIRCKVDNDYLEAVKPFMVNQYLCEVSSLESTYALKKDRLKVSLVDGDYLRINQVIDLSDYTADSEIFNLNITPTAPHEADFTILNIKLIDICDPNSYLRFTLQSSPTNPYASYALSGATNQPLTGFEAELGRLHRNNQWGSYFPLSFSNEEGANTAVNVRIDSKTKEVYSNPNYRIIDLDDPDFFANKWNGFTSGKVYIEISASSYLKNYANFEITSIQGKKVTSIYSIDNEKPHINIDYEMNEIPFGVVNQEFKLFNASSYDEIDGDCLIDVKVYQNYLKTNQYDINIDQDNNCFIPDHQGIYTIVYRSTDNSGNTAIKSIDIDVRDCFEKVNLSIIKSTQTTEGLLGKKVGLAKYIVSGGSGKKIVDTNVKFEGSEVAIIDNSFIPVKEGNYEIIYSVTDYLGNKFIVTYNFLGKRSDELIFDTEINLPRYLINGKDYTFPALLAIDYSKGYANFVESIVYVEIDGQRMLAKDDMLIATAASTIKVIYDFGDQSFEKEVEVIDVGSQNSLDLSSYFHSSSNVENEVSDIGISFASHNKHEIFFIRELLAKELSIKLQVIDGMNLSDFSIIVEDSMIEDERVIFTYQKNNYEAIFMINGKPLYYITECGFNPGSQSNDFYLRIHNNYVNPFSNVKLPINTFANGKEFTGFSSGRVYLSIAVNNTGLSEVLIRNICGQPFSSTTKDRNKPMICLSDDYGGEYGINEKVKIDSAYAVDVLDPNIDFAMKVLDPDGLIVSDINDKLLEDVNPELVYYFIIEKYGSYHIVYEASDSNNGLKQSLSYSIISEDKEAPKIDFDIKGKLKVNSKITITNLTITDNLHDELEIYAYVVGPNGQVIEMAKGYYSFRPLTIGTYRIAVCAYDKTGNMGIKEITIKV